jgi:4'-phosphopantetheinyl transferase
MSWRAPPGDLALLPGELHVWRIDLARARVDQAALSDEEQARAARFLLERDRRRFVASHAALRRILTRYLGPVAPRFADGPHGKPFLDGAALRFNLSHSGELALVAVADGREVGVDVEAVRELDLAGMARVSFSPRERAALFALPPDERLPAFFRCWTRKEAHLKATGFGLALPLDGFDVSLGPDEPARLVATRPDPDEARRFSLLHLDVGPGYAAAVEVAGPPPALVLLDGTD